MIRALDALLGLWTTTEIAAQMKCSPTEVSRWRGAFRRPQPSRVRAIGDALAALRAAPGEPTNEQMAEARRDVAEAVAKDAASRRPDHAR